MPKNWGLHGIFHHGMHLSAVVSYDDERVFDKEGNEIQVSIIKTYSKRERKKFIYIYAEMMMMCFISYVSSHGVKKIILLYTMMSKIFDVCSLML